MERYIQRGRSKEDMNYSTSIYTQGVHSKLNRSDPTSKIADRPGSKFHVGDEVYIQIVDCTGMLRRGGPYLIAKVLGGGKYTLCYHNGDSAEGGREIDEKYLVAA